LTQELPINNNFSDKATAAALYWVNNAYSKQENPA